MSSKEIYCYRILKAYSLIINFDGDAERANVPGPVDGETFKRWKKRVLGDSTSNVEVFTPTIPAPNTKIETLRNVASADHLERVFRAFSKDKDAKKTEAIHEAVAQKEHQLSTLPKAVLNDILAETEHALEPSVKEFFKRFNTKVAMDIDVEHLLRDLINTYNDTVRLARHARNKFERSSRALKS